MVLKILRMNQRLVNAPKEPVTMNKAVQIRNMYPKYNMYVMSIFEASKLPNQMQLKRKDTNATLPEVSNENHHHL